MKPHLKSSRCRSCFAKQLRHYWRGAALLTCCFWWPSISRAAAAQPGGQTGGLIVIACASSGFSGAVLTSDALGKTRFQACGLADRGSARPITRRTRFKAFSISKSITALAVLRLEAAGRLSTSAELGRYLGDAPRAWRNITLEQLLQHTSGLPDLTNDLADRLLQDPQLDWAAAMTRLFKQHAADLPPVSGSWRYNNFGYEIIARVVERVAGKPFPVAVRELVFQPAGMSTAYVATRTKGSEGLDRQLATGYLCPADGDGVAISHSFVQRGAGGVILRPDDLLALSRSIQSGRLVSHPRMQRSISQAYGGTGGAPYAEGFLVREATGIRYLQHSGGNKGYVSDWGFDPTGRVAAVVLTNSSCAAASDLRAKLMGVLLDGASRLRTGQAH